jgi:hypothetical protein
MAASPSRCSAQPNDGTTVEVIAARAVILSCGGFAYSPDMMKQFLAVSIPAFVPDRGRVP